MFIKRAVNRQWAPTGHSGIERSLLRQNATGGRTSLVTLEAGTRFPRHAHPRHAHHGTEEVLVLSGRVAIGGETLQAGDYLFTEPGEEHDVAALEASVIYVASEKGTPVVEP